VFEPCEDFISDIESKSETNDRIKTKQIGFKSDHKLFQCTKAIVKGMNTDPVEQYAIISSACIIQAKLKA
jgi:hypothetical protein